MTSPQRFSTPLPNSVAGVANRGVAMGCISSPSEPHPIVQNGQEGRMRLLLSRLLLPGPSRGVIRISCNGLKLSSGLACVPVGERLKVLRGRCIPLAHFFRDSGH